MLIKSVILIIFIFINSLIAEEINCPISNENISVHLITDGYYNYEDYLHYSLGKFSTQNKKQYTLTTSKEFNLKTMSNDIIFGEFNELRKIINEEKNLITPDFIGNFYIKNEITNPFQDNNLYPLDLDTYILVSKEEINDIKNEEDIYNFVDVSKYTISQSFYSRNETINFFSYLLMGNGMDFKNPFFESILYNQKYKYSLLNKNTFLGSYEEVINSYNNNENLYTVLPDGFAYHEKNNFINYPNSEVIWDNNIGQFKINDIENIESFFGFSALVNKKKGFDFLCNITKIDAREIILKDFNLGISPLSTNDVLNINQISPKYKKILKLKSKNINNLDLVNTGLYDENFHKNIIKFMISQSDLILNDSQISFFKD